MIKGWDKGCLGMGLGETRRILIPADEGYGKKGFAAWGIQPGAILHFEIEVMKIKGGEASAKVVSSAEAAEQKQKLGVALAGLVELDKELASAQEAAAGHGDGEDGWM